MIDFNLDFYSIIKCGYFKRGEIESSFGNINDLFTDYGIWIDGKSIQRTKTYEQGKYLNRLPVYCYDFYKIQETQDILLITWNETMNEDGTIYSIPGNSQVGQSELNTSSVPDGNIPGYATYFWFIPEKQLLCSLRPEGQALNGQDNLKTYLKNFLEISPSFTIYDGSDIIGYSNGNPTEVTPVIPKFETRMKYRDTQLEGIRSKVNEIRKIVIKNKLYLRDEVKRGFMRSILDNVFLPNREIGILQETDYKLEFDFEPNIEDLNSIIDGWNESGDESDIGFLYTGGSQSPEWLSHTNEKHQISLNIDRNPGEVISAEILLSQINRIREDIINSLDL